MPIEKNTHIIVTITNSLTFLFTNIFYRVYIYKILLSNYFMFKININETHDH